MKKLKITVMKIAVHDDLIEKYENQVDEACPVKLGQSFIVSDMNKPAELCDSAWVSLYPFAMALSAGAENLYDSWMKNPQSAMVSCNDGFRPVSFLLETI